jgi:hypothetical protein
MIQLFVTILKFIFGATLTTLLFILNAILTVAISIGFILLLIEICKLFKGKWYYDKNYY